MFNDINLEDRAQYLRDNCDAVEEITYSKSFSSEELAEQPTEAPTESETIEVVPVEEVGDPEPKPEPSDVEIGDCFKMENGTMIIKVVAIHKSFTRHEAIWSTGTEIGFYANKSLLTEKVSKMERYDAALYEQKKSQIMAILNNKVEF